MTHEENPPKVLRWPVAAPPAASRAFVFAVNEGVTYRVTNAEVQHKYQPVADDLSNILGQKVNFVAVSDYREIALGLSAARYDLAYVHPTHLALKGLAMNGYRLVALTRGYTDYRAHFLVRGDCAARTAADLHGRKVGSPAADSITSVLMRATFREVAKYGADGVSYVFTRYQDAVPFMVEHGLVDAGVTGSDSVARAWTAGGGQVAFSSKPVPVKLMLASKRVSFEVLTALQDYFTSLEQSDRGRRILETIDKMGFVPFDGNALAAVNDWLALGLRGQRRHRVGPAHG
jgi:phosphonate transport system substrate-binding protein